jgi:tetratricopeptide (TPR) repeat protein
MTAKIRDVVQSRTAGLDQRARDVLDIAAVMGEAFSAPVIALVLRAEPIDAERTLASLEHGSRLVRSSRGGYRFDHIKIQEVLYGELTPTLRAAWHERVADALLTFEGQDRPGDLAFHYSRGPDPERALPHLLQAAKNAEAEFANEEAARFYSHVLTLELDVDTKCEALDRLGTLRLLEGDLERARTSYEKALELPVDNSRRGHLLSQLGQVIYRQGEAAEAVEVLERGLDLLGERTLESQTETELLNNLGVVLEFLGEEKRALDVLGRALEIRERSGTNKDIAGTLCNIGVVHYYNKRMKGALEVFQRAASLLEGTGEME